MPTWPGSTPITPPPMPLFDGMPARATHSLA
jgi:hypothetical protein